MPSLGAIYRRPDETVRGDPLDLVDAARNSCQHRQALVAGEAAGKGVGQRPVVPDLLRGAGVEADGVPEPGAVGAQVGQRCPALCSLSAQLTSRDWTGLSSR